jgi:NADH-quinone oxidoreductase subunit N
MTTESLPLSVVPLIPLLALVGTALGILVAELWQAPWRFSAWLALTGMTVTAALALIVVLSGQSSVIQGVLAIDGTAALFTLLFCAAGAVVVLLELGSVRTERGARYALVLFVISGAVIVAQSTHLLTLVLGLTIATVASSALIGFVAAWQHHVQQIASLACVLFGAVLLYGAAGSLRFDILVDRLGPLAAETQANPLAALGLGFTLGGLGIPLGIVPFHTSASGILRRMRARDGCLVSLLLAQVAAAALTHLAGTWSSIGTALVTTLGAVSLLYGYADALRRRRVHDALQGVVMAQSGTLLLHIALIPTEGWTRLFYALGNAGLNLACLWAAVVNARTGGDTPLQLDDLAGLGRRRPWLAGALTLCLLNLAGAPPLTGAVSRLWLLRATWTAGQEWAAALAVGGSLAAWFFAGRWTLTLWMSARKERAWAPTTPEVIVVGVAAGGGMLLAGIYAGPIWHWIAAVVAGP